LHRLPERWPTASLLSMRLTRLLPLATTAAIAVCAAGTATAAAAVTHTVRRGETLTSVAATDGLSVSSLAAANGVSARAQLTAGTQLVIPPRGPAGAAPAAAPISTTPASPGPATVFTPSSGGVLVVLGDTLTSIAARHGTSVEALAAANDIRPGDLLLAGRRLALPGVSAPVPAPTPPASAAVTDPMSGGPIATHTFVSPSQVASIASDDGVAPSLAEAIADQESGFDNDEVSSTGATGVMQIEPGTWRDLTGSQGLNLADDSALDNVRGGVTLLGDLLTDTGGDEPEAIAAYYQGLQSVRARGMYADTRRYVRDVLALQRRFGG
jgi:LysM repeat protein